MPSTEPYYALQRSIQSFARRIESVVPQETILGFSLLVDDLHRNLVTLKQYTKHAKMRHDHSERSRRHEIDQQMLYCKRVLDGIQVAELNTEPVLESSLITVQNLLVMIARSWSQVSQNSGDEKPQEESTTDFGLKGVSPPTPNRHDGSLYIHYTISEYRCGSEENRRSALLAGLGDRVRSTQLLTSEQKGPALFQVTMSKRSRD